MQIALVVHVCFSILIACNAAPKLSRIVIISRHGHRNPLALFPNHELFFSAPPDYTGALSEIGEDQAKSLGQIMRNTYKSQFEVDEFEPNNVFGSSSNTPRTIRSGELFLDNLLRDNKSEIGVEKISEDFWISQFAPCKMFEDYFIYHFKEIPKEHQELLDKHRDLLRNLSAYSGWELDTVKKAGLLYDAIYSDRVAGRRVPGWGYLVDGPRGLRPFSDALLDRFLWNEWMVKEKSGPLINDIKIFFNSPNHIDVGNDIKFYSGHDLTIKSVAKAYGIAEQIGEIGFASTLVFESHANKTVKVRFFGSNVDPKEIELPECPSPCSLQKFTDITEHKVVEMPSDFCHNDGPNQAYKDEFLDLL